MHGKRPKRTSRPWVHPNQKRLYREWGMTILAARVLYPAKDKEIAALLNAPSGRKGNLASDWVVDMHRYSSPTRFIRPGLSLRGLGAFDFTAPLADNSETDGRE